jgi:hypothetical protein
VISGRPVLQETKSKSISHSKRIIIIIIIISTLRMKAVDENKWGDLECLYRACQAAINGGGFFTDDGREDDEARVDERLATVAEPSLQSQVIHNILLHCHSHQALATIAVTLIPGAYHSYTKVSPALSQPPSTCNYSSDSHTRRLPFIYQG